MGTNMLVIAEERVDGRYRQMEDFFPFDERSYAIFGFFADVRNEHNIPPISRPRGIPSDSPIYGLVEDGKPDVCDWSWLSVAELEEFDYDSTFEEGPHDGSILPHYKPVEPGHGPRLTFREALGPYFFRELATLRPRGVERILIAFFA